MTSVRESVSQRFLISELPRGCPQRKLPTDGWIGCGIEPSIWPAYHIDIVLTQKSLTEAEQVPRAA